ncbi:hypothetical protein [Actinoplanes sp. NPDC020271]|uniref:hypothetical protein n=1 Tax=Actinoplanes sp. NPDC020271 TaxID=3363896 RepID=UPI0037ABAC15
MTPSRALRPLHLFTDGDVVWAVDEFQPVAAVLDASGGMLRDLVSWPRLPPPPLGETWQVLSYGPDLWVQPGEGGPVGRIGRTGLAAAGYSAGRLMVAVESRGAWCLNDGGFRQRLVHRPDHRPGPLPHDQVIVVNPAGDVHRLGMDRPDHPGIRLRRGVRLFDEAGRPDPPEFADIHLVEDIDTGRLPPAGAASGGFLDV